MTMRIYWFLALCAVSSSIAAAPERLEEAIEQSNVPLVDLVSHEFVRGPDALPDKKACIYDLTLMADDAVAFLKGSRFVINDERDCGMALFGSAMFSLGAYYTARDCYPMYRLYRSHGTLPGRKEMGSAGLKFSVMVLGGFLAYKGLTCAFQNDRIKRARAVRRLLEGRLADLSL